MASFLVAPNVFSMEKKDKLPSWPEIRDADPELAARCRAGDTEAIIEFVKRALGGEVIE